jgi:hypothetical protein
MQSLRDETHVIHNKSFLDSMVFFGIYTTLKLISIIGSHKENAKIAVLD